MDDATLQSLNRRGLFPGHMEDEAAFLRRIELLKTQLATDAVEGSCPLPMEDWKKAHALTTALFDIQPDWIAAVYSAKGLPFWERAAAWEVAKSGSTFHLIQLQPVLKKGKLYSLEEVLAHEAVHAVRSHLKQNRFEEIMAYRTSRFSYRKWLGPIFRKPWETNLFLLSLLFSLFLVWFGNGSVLLDCLTALPFFLLAYWYMRLQDVQGVFKKCLQNLSQCLTNPERALAVALRLTDDEISHFSRMRPAEIAQYVAIGKKSSLRFKVIALEYFDRPEKHETNQR
ncbi:MAG TPA: hypothetical protein VJ112_05170 [Rhabdochlamydiaceae bacterium]|nr:hypothetical protein [Rhabdochlamydiaceae bacterium]